MADPFHPAKRSDETEPGCLDPEALADFAAGRLSPGEKARADAHVAGCPFCRERLEALARRDDGGLEATLLNPSQVSEAPPPPPSPGEIFPGQQVGRYRVERLLGTGGMGQVFLAQDPELDRRVALKVLRDELADRGLEARLLREARAMARLSHPNVVTVHDVGTWNGQVFLAMEYVEGGTLADWLDAPRSVRQVLDVFRLAGAGLAAAHAAGLVHRDFKPENVLMGQDGSVRVSDFGLARAEASPEAVPAPEAGGTPAAPLAVTVAGSVMGTPAYMSPEQHQGRPTDARTDQFSFCVALFEALYGQRPFPGDDVTVLRAAVTTGALRLPPPTERVPLPVRDAVLRGLSLDPAHRFPKMEALLAALDHAPEAAAPRARLHPARGWALGLLATSAVLALSFTSVWRSFEERAQGLLLAGSARPWSEQVVLLSVDQASLRMLGSPMPRRMHARVLEALAGAGAKAVAYDVSFFQQPPDGAEAEARFAQALSTYGRAVMAAPCTIDEDDTAGLSALLERSALPLAGVPGTPCEGVVLPAEKLRGSAPLAAVESVRSVSGNVRGAFQVVDVAGRKLPGLALATLAAGEGVPLSAVAASPGGLRVGAFEVPLSPLGGLLASFRFPLQSDVLSLREVVAALPPSGPAVLPEALAARLRGRYVLYGQTAEAAKDIGPLADGRQLPLVLVHGALLADLLERRPVREVPRGVEVLLVLGFGALLTGAALRLRPLLSVAALAVAGQGVWGGSLLLAKAGWVVSPLAPVTAAVLALALVLAGRAAAQERERRRVLGALDTYLNGPTLQRVLRAPQKTLSLEGARARVSVLSAVLPQTEEEARLPPEEVVAKRRARLHAMAARVLAADGRVETLRADGLVAVFGEPLPSADHARRAVGAGLEMQRALSAEPGPLPRVGVATGQVLVGDMGADGRIEYAVLGAPVELAGELSRRAPPGAVLLAGETREACGEAFRFERAPESGTGAPAYLARPRR